MKFKLLALLGMIIFLIGCSPSSSTTSNPSTEVPTTEVPSTEVPTTEVPTITESPTISTFPTTTAEPAESYVKDEEGFFILEDDCFTPYSHEDGFKKSKVKWASEVEDMEYSTYFRLYLGDKRIPIYNIKVNNGHSWNEKELSRMESGVAIINMEGRATFKLQTTFLINNQFTIRPSAKGVKHLVDEARRVITFEITSTGQYTLEFRGGRTLHLFVNPYEGYEHEAKYDRVIRFKKGVHTGSNNGYIVNRKINVQSNTTIILEPGAIIEAGFISNNTENIQIIGDGVVLGANFNRSPITNEHLIPFDFNYCENIEFIGISTLDPAAWSYNLYFCKNITIKDIKIISSRHNGDGISLQSCQNAYVSDSFLRTWDDNLVVKNYPQWSDRTKHGTTDNITFERCLLWTDLAQSMEVGFETVGEVMQNITFNDITVLHNFHKAPISIHNGNNANIKNVTFKNITIEDAQCGLGDGRERIIDISNEYSINWSEKHTSTPLGQMEDIFLDNILFIEGTKNPIVKVAGAIDPRDTYDKDIHYVKEVNFNDVWIYDQLLTDQYSNLRLKYSEDITFTKTRDAVTGCSIYWEESTNHGNNLEITII